MLQVGVHRDDAFSAGDRKAGRQRELVAEVPRQADAANARLGFEPDLRNYGIGAQILLDLGLRIIRPITNNPRKLVGLEGYGLTVDQRVPIISIAHDENSSYLEAKRAKLGHLFAS